MKNKIYVIHENDEWIEPLRKELQEILTHLSKSGIWEKEMLIIWISHRTVFFITE